MKSAADNSELDHFSIPHKVSAVILFSHCKTENNTIRVKIEAKHH